jgi:hypothetical protein
MTATLAPARGLRNKNPGNLRHNAAFDWLGEIAPDAQGYCRFDSDHDGLRACALDLLTKWRRDGLRTVRAIITRYAPPTENATGNYVAAVTAALGVKPDDALDLSAAGTLALLVKAVVRQECGSVPYLISDVVAAVQAALGLPHPSDVAPPADDLAPGGSPHR